MLAHQWAALLWGSFFLFWGYSMGFQDKNGPVVLISGIAVVVFFGSLIIEAIWGW